MTDHTNPPRADRPINWGILSTGGIAAVFTEDLLRMDDARVVAVASRKLDTAQSFADRYGIETAYGSWDELAADDNVDVVYIASPHSAHYEGTMKCLTGGRSVLCEKAFALNSKHTAAMFDLAAERQLFLMEAMWMRCNPAIQHMKELIDDGAIGRVQSVRADFHLPGPFPPEHRLRDPELGGGSLLDLGIYPLSLAYLVLGNPTDVTATAHLTKEGVDTNLGMLLRYPDDGMAVLSSGLNGVAENAAEIIGSEGRIALPPTFFRPDRFTIYRRDAEPEVVEVPFEGHGYVHQAAEVMSCLRSGRIESNLVPKHSTVDVMAIMDEIRRQIGVRYPTD